jgi:hypothetical protein
MLKAMLDKTGRALTFWLRRTRIEFPLVASACCLWLLSAVEVAFAGEPAPPTVEFPAWSRTYAGIVGGRQVEVALTRVDRSVEGAYCFAPCARNRQDSIHVQGTIKGDQIQLSEGRRDVERTQVQQVSWHARLHGSHMVGRRENSGMGVAQGFDLADTQPLPYETKLVADTRPGNDDACETPPHVVAIKLYRGRRLVQRLATDSQGTCQVFVPQAVDANFDGRTDITIALDLPASPNVPYQTWLFNPRTQRFSLGPKLLQKIALPEYDYKHKVIASSWRDGCCSHGVTTYRWRGGRLIEDETMQSYALPVLADDGKRRYCYSGPSYIDGHIVFDDRVEERDGRLSITVADVGACEETYGIAPDTRIDIWQRGPGRALRLARTEQVHWRPVLNGGRTRYCPEVPFFDHGRIVRVILDDDERAACTDDEP